MELEVIFFLWKVPQPRRLATRRSYAFHNSQMLHIAFRHVKCNTSARIVLLSKKMSWIIQCVNNFCSSWISFTALLAGAYERSTYVRGGLGTRRFLRFGSVAVRFGRVPWKKESITGNHFRRSNVLLLFDSPFNGTYEFQRNLRNLLLLLSLLRLTPHLPRGRIFIISPAACEINLCNGWQTTERAHCRLTVFHLTATADSPKFANLTLRRRRDLLQRGRNAKCNTSKWTKKKSNKFNTIRREEAEEASLTGHVTRDNGVWLTRQDQQ